MDSACHNVSGDHASGSHSSKACPTQPPEAAPLVVFVATAWEKADSPPVIAPNAAILATRITPSG